jgi:hypothetical protein
MGGKRYAKKSVSSIIGSPTIDLINYSTVAHRNCVGSWKRAVVVYHYIRVGIWRILWRLIINYRRLKAC